MLELKHQATVLDVLRTGALTDEVAKILEKTASEATMEVKGEK
jgi:hypothetical protein